MRHPSLTQRPGLFAVVSRLRKQLREHRGYALMMVLSMTGLAMTMILALLSTADTSYKVENTAWERARAQMVAESAVGLALGQLKRATSGEFEDGTPRPWTSQPGAIRTYEMDGSLAELHKLYTAVDMSVGDIAAVDADLPADWQSNPDAFVDLNEPVVNSAGVTVFPVVDPRAQTGDPATAVEGFDYDGAYGAVRPSVAGPETQRLPMPVRWIYQRRDGTLATPGPGGRLFPSDSVANPNPVVARFAYWVDDESCKVNINTAGEGSYWDTPVADTTQERDLAKNQPTRREYQRQAGHPSGVCLSSVFMPNRRLYPAGFEPETSWNGVTMTAMTLDDARDLWRLGRLAVAELSDHTSWAGTVRPDWSALWDTTPIPIMRQKPYASVSELVFDKANPNDFPALWQNVPGNGQLMVHSFFRRHPEAVRRLGHSEFFLTAHSSAPEVTLHGTPRIALWPIHANTLLNKEGPNPGDPTQRDTSYDHKAVRITELKGRNYLVVRSEPGDGGRDLEVHGGGTNKRLLDYLTRLTDRAVPGFFRPAEGETTFAAKYGDDRQAILLQMLDYVRATNFADGQLTQNSQFSILCPGQEHHGFGQIAPLRPLETGKAAAKSVQPQGFGRMMTVSEIALIITRRAEVIGMDEKGKPIFRGTPSTDSNNKSELTQVGDCELEAGLLVEGFVPGQGWSDYRPYMSIGLYGGGRDDAPMEKGEIPSLSLNGKPLVLRDTKKIIEVMASSELPPTEWQGAGGTLGVRSLAKGAILFKPIVVKASSGKQEVKFIGAATDTKQLKLAVYGAPGSAGSPASAVKDLVQVIPLALPDIEPVEGVPGLPLPTLPGGIEKTALVDRIEAAATQGKPLITSGDIVQSLAPIHGDYRLTATQRWARSSDGTLVFVPHKKWGKEPQAHTLRDATLSPGGSTQGFVLNLNFDPASRPDMSSTLSDAISQSSDLLLYWKAGKWERLTVSEQRSPIDLLRNDGLRRGPALPEITGDFDNGVGNLPDGPYTNRPDDGHWAAALDLSKVPYFDNVSQTGPTVPPVSAAAFSPQRLLPSPVMFGSLPTGARAQVPWQTLLFRPQPGHYGAQSPPDHLLLDLFWSPVIEPEPVSHLFETKGKINLNHELLPFRHIKRTTALHAAMKAEAITAIPDSASATYKTQNKDQAAMGERFRHFIDTDATLKLWDDAVFSQGKAFLTASQICEHPLVPEGLFSPGEDPTREAVDSYWQEHRLTGDNTKERPYAHLYSRLTTRSNTFRVHFIAQSLVKSRSGERGVFDSSLDRVTATVRGSCLLQRELNAEHPDMPDYTAPATASSGPVKPMDAFYRWGRTALKVLGN